MDSYEDLYYTRRYSDVQFIIDGETVRAHRCILSSKCTYFATMLFGMTNEAKMETIELQVESVEIFEQVLRFAYLNDLYTDDWNLDQLLALLTLSHEYLYKELTDEVQKKIIQTHIDEESFAALYDIAVQYSLWNLRDACVQYAEKQANMIIGNTDIFASLSRDLLQTLLYRDCYAKAGEQILAAILSWRRAHPDEKCSELLLRINYESFGRKTLANLVLAAVADSNFVPREANIAYSSVTRCPFNVQLAASDHLRGVTSSQRFFVIRNPSLLFANATREEVQQDDFLTLPSMSSYERGENDWIEFRFNQIQEANRIEFSIYGVACLCRITVALDYRSKKHYTPIFLSRSGPVTTFCIRVDSARIYEIRFNYKYRLMFGGLKLLMAENTREPQPVIHIYR